MLQSATVSCRSTAMPAPTYSSRKHTYQRMAGYLSGSRLHFSQSQNIEFSSVDVDGDEDGLEEDLLDDLDASEDDDHVDNPTMMNLPKGTNEGFYVVKVFKTESTAFDMDHIRALVDEDDVKRLELNSQNISVPIGLMMADREEFPSVSRARKACRKANIMIHRGPVSMNEKTGEVLFDSTKCLRARVGDRVFPGGRSNFLNQMIRHAILLMSLLH